ncbi:hypothetical protein AB6A40_001452 [Gnathostoma spinigerum]|uniref:Major facilitator superfamily (MFS) profile domain-containing protein n=1 Tax=Gnathostoma spinigerum TaxID=75299 RepID=A0ABD6ED30_9BILA
MSISKISPADDDITEVEALPQPQHNPKIGFFVYLLSFLAVVGGFLFGYDTGIVSSAMMYLPHYKGMIPMNSLWKELIVSITPGMAAVGAVLAGPASDRLGRKKVILASSFVFTVGGVVCAVAFEKICLLVGRILLGLAIGFASMVVPIYVGEASPAYIRGRLVTAFQLMITFGLFASNAIAGGFSYIDPENIGWRLMLAFASLPSLLQLIGFLFMPESPRYLFGTGDVENVTKTLERIYAGDEEWINYELREIEISHNLERKAKAQVGDQLVIWRMLTTPHVRRALLIGCALQMFQQLCGINTIMYYTATIIKSAGVEDIHNTIWIAVGISSINFLATFFPLALVERFGRRFLLLLSVAGVIIALILMGVAFLLINQDSMRSEVNFDVKETELALRCRKYDNCDFCVTDEACGFCKRADGTAKKGWCLPVDEDEPSHSTQGVCGIGHDPKIYEYHSDYCVTKYTAMPIAVMVFYLTSFAVGNVLMNFFWFHFLTITRFTQQITVLMNLHTFKLFGHPDLTYSLMVH